MDGRKNNGGTKGNKGGSPGYGKLSFIKNKVEKHSKDWWEEWEKMMKNTDKDTTNKRFAMTEFNKLQIKLMPTVLSGDDENPLILQFDETFKLTSKTEADS